MNKEEAPYAQLYAEKLKKSKLTEADVAFIFSISDLNEWQASTKRGQLLVSIGNKLSNEINQLNIDIRNEIHWTLLHLYKERLHETDMESWFRISKSRRAARILLALV